MFVNGMKTETWLQSKLLVPLFSQVNMVSIGTVATEIQLASIDNVLATGVTATLLAPDGVWVVTWHTNHKNTVCCSALTL